MWPGGLVKWNRGGIIIGHSNYQKFSYSEESGYNGTEGWEDWTRRLKNRLFLEIFKEKLSNLFKKNVSFHRYIY